MGQKNKNKKMLGHCAVYLPGPDLAASDAVRALQKRGVRGVHPPNLVSLPYLPPLLPRHRTHTNTHNFSLPEKQGKESPFFLYLCIRKPEE